MAQLRRLRLLSAPATWGLAVSPWSKYSPPWPITGSVRSASMAVPGKGRLCGSSKSWRQRSRSRSKTSPAVTTWVTKLMPEEAVGLRVASVKRDPVQLEMASPRSRLP